VVDTFHTCETGSSRLCESLIKTFCELEICCALVGKYPAYIAGVLTSYYKDSLRLGQLCIFRTDSPILDNIYKKLPTFEIEPFMFSITAGQEYANYRDNSVYEITYGDVTVPFLLAIVDVSVPTCIQKMHRKDSE